MQERATHNLSVPKKIRASNEEGMLVMQSKENLKKWERLQ